MELIIVLAATLLGAGQHDHRAVDVPIAYRGRWVLDVSFCRGEPGPASVLIEARSIHFYERHGYLRLGQLNEASDPPVFTGRFDFVQQGRFSDRTERLELAGSRLSITEADDPDAPANPRLWTRCP